MIEGHGCCCRTRRLHSIAPGHATQAGHQATHPHAGGATAIPASDHTHSLERDCPIKRNVEQQLRVILLATQHGAIVVQTVLPGLEDALA